MSEPRVVEFGATRYEFVDGHWWPDVTPQERVLVEELERQRAGMRQLLAERDALRGIAAGLYRAVLELDTYSDGMARHLTEVEAAIDAYMAAFPEADQ